MLCAQCAAPSAIDSGVCAACGASPLVAGRYRLDRVLGRGAAGTTYAAIRLADGAEVCVKELAYNRLSSFEVEERFQRECSVLRQLAHPGIPRYVDDLASGEGKARSLYLVQELVHGASLAAELATRRYREDEVLEVVAELADILVYLHTLSPPVIHRDLKPANVLRRTDGRLVLVDFGAVKDALKESVVGASVVGTFGYMPPEQLYGKAVPASDLYALGALAVALLGRCEPVELMDDRHQLAWQGHVAVHPATAQFLRDLLEPEIARRLGSAREARARALAIAREIAAERAAPATAHVVAHAPVDRVVPIAQPPGPPSAPVSAPAPTPARKGRGAGVAVMVLFGVALIVAVAVASRGSRGTAGGGSQVFAPVPDGLLGLTAGMSIDQARMALPELANAPIEDGTKYLPPMQLLALGGAGTASFEFVQLPGHRLSGTTLIAGTTAACTFDFAVDDGLSKIACALAAPTSQTGLEALEAGVLEQLGARYGLTAVDGNCAVGGGAPRESFQHHRRCAWEAAGAELEFKASWMDGMRMTTNSASAVITWQSKAHRQLVDRLEAESRERADAARRAEEAKQAADRQREIDRLKNASGTSGRPL